MGYCQAAYRWLTPVEPKLSAERKLLKTPSTRALPSIRCTMILGRVAAGHAIAAFGCLRQPRSAKLHMLSDGGGPAQPPL